MTIVSAQSDLGLINPPINTDKYNLGVEKGPSVIIENLHLDGKIIEQKFSKAKDTNLTEYKQKIENEYAVLKNKIINQHNPKDFLLTLGGDHSVAYSSLSAVIEIYKKKSIGVIMFDSHADIHNWETSPSNNFHGIWLRAVIEEMEFNPNNILYVGNLDIEQEERDYLIKHNIKNVTRTDLLNDAKKFVSDINVFISQYEQMHFSFDVDMLDNNEFKATGCFIEDGFKRSEVLDIFQRVDTSSLKSLDIVEFNPDRSTDLQSDLDFIEEVMSELIP